MVLRWCIVGVALFVAFLYYQPLSSYLQTRSALNERAAEVQRLREERTRLQARLADSETVAALAREARRMRLVRPGERIFIVKGVAEWRRAEARANRGGIGRRAEPRGALLTEAAPESTLRRHRPRERLASYHRRRWMTVRSWSSSSAGRRAHFGA